MKQSCNRQHVEVAGSAAGAHVHLRAPEVQLTTESLSIFLGLCRRTPILGIVRNVSHMHAANMLSETRYYVQCKLNSDPK